MTASTSFPSSSPPPSPPPLPDSVSKSSTTYPVVHPVPEPAAQACFSVPPPLHTTGHQDKTQKGPRASLSYSETEQTSPFINNKAPTLRSLSCCESQEVSSPLSASECGRRSPSSLPVSLLHEQKLESFQDNRKTEQDKVLETSQETKLSQDDHLKVNLIIFSQ